MTVTAKLPFDDCKGFQGGRRTPPPSHLLRISEIKLVSLPMGASNETYYRCRECDMKWLWEAGSCGYGWASFQRE